MWLLRLLIGFRVRLHTALSQPYHVWVYHSVFPLMMNSFEIHLENALHITRERFGLATYSAHNFSKWRFAIKRKASNQNQDTMVNINKVGTVDVLSSRRRWCCAGASRDVERNYRHGFGYLTHVAVMILQK